MANENSSVTLSLLTTTLLTLLPNATFDLELDVQSERGGRADRRG